MSVYVFKRVFSPGGMAGYQVHLNGFRLGYVGLVGGRWFASVAPPWVASRWEGLTGFETREDAALLLSEW